MSAVIGFLIAFGGIIGGFALAAAWFFPEPIGHEQGDDL